MKPNALTVLILSASIVIAADKKTTESESSFSWQIAADRLFYTLHGDLRRPFGGGTVEFKCDSEGVRIIRNDGTVIYRIEPPRSLDGMVVSEDQRIMLLLVKRSDTKAPFYDFIARIACDVEGRTQVKEFMPGSKPDFNASGVWVSELGAVSNDGRTALLRLSRPYQVRDEDETTLYFYDWQTWDIESPRKISDGLQMSNSR